MFNIRISIYSKRITILTGTSPNGHNRVRYRDDFLLAAAATIIISAWRPFSYILLSAVGPGQSAALMNADALFSPYAATQTAF